MSCLDERKSMSTTGTYQVMEEDRVSVRRWSQRQSITSVPADFFEIGIRSEPARRSYKKRSSIASVPAELNIPVRSSVRAKRDSKRFSLVSITEVKDARSKRNCLSPIPNRRASEGGSPASSQFGRVSRLGTVQSISSPARRYSRFSSGRSRIYSMVVAAKSEHHLSQEEEESAAGQAERNAFNQTKSAHYVLMGIEMEVMEAARRVGRLAETAAGGAHLVNRRKRTSCSDGVNSNETAQRRVSRISGGDDRASSLLSFIPTTMLRCIAHGLVYPEQWRVLVESPSNSSYDPVLTKFPAALVFADASVFYQVDGEAGDAKQGRRENWCDSE